MIDFVATSGAGIGVGGAGVLAAVEATADGDFSGGVLSVGGFSADFAEVVATGATAGTGEGAGAGLCAASFCGSATAAGTPAADAGATAGGLAADGLAADGLAAGEAAAGGAAADGDAAGCRLIAPVTESIPCSSTVTRA
jgi:hypothetical protein